MPLEKFTQGQCVKVLKENWKNYPSWQDVIDATFVVDHPSMLEEMQGYMWTQSPYSFNRLVPYPYPFNYFFTNFNARYIHFT
jgi:hypothetical protein